LTKDLPKPLPAASEPAPAPPPPPTQGPVPKTATQELREELGKLAERVAVLEAALTLRTRCRQCGAPGAQVGCDPTGMLRCFQCGNRWWQGGAP
jgi:hypothetical protein